jgi:phosphate transport system ATP-binding protein
MKKKIEIRSLNVFIEGNHILKDVNIDIPENKITVVIGPSGCGKTTFLRTLNRLTDLDEKIIVSGDIIIDKENILNTAVDITQIRKKMGLLSQRPYTLPMNIFDNVAYGLKINGLKNKNELAVLVEHNLEKVNLWHEVKDRLKESPLKLSVGQQQRLCLARGLAVEPEIILADEPTSALDPLSSQAIEAAFTDLKEKYSIILVTHILRQAKRMADHVVFMYLGEVIEQGPAEEFFNNPRHEKTKLYLQGAFN